MPEQHILLYDDADPITSGHHLQYIGHLIDYWIANRISGRLEVAVVPRFEQAADLAEMVKKGRNSGVRLVPLDPPSRSYTGGSLDLVRAAFERARVLRSCVERVRPASCVLMVLDHFQPSLAAGLRFGFPVQCAGIYFRPSFHYGDFGMEADVGERIRRLRKRAMLALAMRNPHLSHIFCLDPYSAPHLMRLNPRVRSIALPDPVVNGPRRSFDRGLARSLRIDGSRRVFLLFGVLSRRKGTLEVLKAAALMSDDACSRTCLVLAGSIPADDGAEVEAHVNGLRERKPLQVIVENRILDETEVARFFDIADLVLVPYQKHVGSSGVLLRAAAAGIPVLGSDYGLVGQQIRAHRLGTAVDTTSPKVLCDAMEEFLRSQPSDGFDGDEARRFAQCHDPDAFAATIFESLMSPEIPEV